MKISQIRFSEVQKDIGITVFHVLVEAVIPLAVAVTLRKENVISTTGQSVLLGVMIWIFFISSHALYNLRRMLTGEKREQVIWDASDAFDATLSAIRNSYQKIQRDSTSRPDIYQFSFEQRGKEFQNVIKGAAETGVLPIDDRHVVTFDILSSSFDGTKDAVLRAVHFFADNEFYFVWGGHYFYPVYDLVKKGKIREVKRLMVYDNESQLVDDKAMQFMTFHAKEKNYSYRVIKMQEFQSMKHDSRMNFPADFGIYGKSYVYKGMANVINNISGEWMRNKYDIEQYINFFETCWKCRFAKTHSKADNGSPVKVQELFP